MRCGKCGSENPTGKKFCTQCGSALAAVCPSCGAENPPSSRFCGDCGLGLLANGAGKQPPSSAVSAPGIRVTATETDPSAAAGGERKTVTALFADIKGSMELMEDLDAEDARAIVDPALKLMIDAVHWYDGYIVQSTGDGIFALFGAPIAHEDHPQRSLYAALRLQDELKRYSDRDDARIRREKVTGRVLALDRALEDALPYLLGLLGLVEGEDPLAQMDGQIKRRRTLDAIKRILLRESMNQPLMVTLEDLHWIDEQTQALLNLLADSIGTAKILLLVNYRPEYSHPWGSRTYYTQLRLDPLGKESADEMLLALLGGGKDLEQLKRVIIDKTEGNPFFMEETVQALLNDGALVRNGATLKLTRPVTELKIPPTVQGILAARIDRLAPHTKELLQTLSVIGREFPISLIRAVVLKSDDELNRMLGDLQLAEFIYEQPAVGDTQYVFKHALTQEVSHNSVLLERRRQLHERIGGAIEGVFAENLEDHLPDLAHHYARSANRAKALEFLHRAGEQAIKRASYSEAGSYFAAALEVVGAMPDSLKRDAHELRLRSSFVQALILSKGWLAPELVETISRASALAERIGNLPELVQQLWARAQHAIIMSGDYLSAVALADQAVATAQREGSPISLGLAHSISLITRFYLGDFVGAEDHFARGRAFFEAPGFLQIGAAAAQTLSYASWNAWITGHADVARERAERLRQVVEGTQRNPWVTAGAQIAAANLHAMLREFARAEALAGEALASCEGHGFADSPIWARTPLGLARAELGRSAEGVALLRRALEAATELGTPFMITETLTYLAEAQVLDGEVDDAVRTIDDALQANPQELFLRPETLRVRGELRLRQGDSGLAEVDFREAISLAQKMSAKAWELRAATSLARLLRDNRRRDEARAMLAEIYNWFTEGFDTADLKDAKALLDELNN